MVRILFRRRCESDFASEGVDADLDYFARLDFAMTLGQLAREFAADDRNGAGVAGLAQANRDFASARRSLADELFDNFAALKDVAVSRESRLMHEHLLCAQAEGLLGLVGQCQRLAKARQLQRIDARVGRYDDRQRLV